MFPPSSLYDDPASALCRYPNDPVTELTNAAVEQMKITELRLRKALGGGGGEVAGGAGGQAERRAGAILAHIVPRAYALLCARGVVWGLPGCRACCGLAPQLPDVFERCGLRDFCSCFQATAGVQQRRSSGN